MLVNRNLLAAAAAELGMQIDEQQMAAFALLLQELVRWNRQINLTAITKPDAMTVKHLIDSFHLVPQLQQGEHLLDIGSGAGFPALVLAIMRPDCRISSIDAVAKKVSFQRHCARLLRLENVQALHGRVEQLALQQPEQFDLVVSRAFSSLELFVDLGLPLVRPGGRIISMRSAEGEHEQQQFADRLLQLGLQSEPCIRYRLPQQMGMRSLVILCKA